MIIKTLIKKCIVLFFLIAPNLLYAAIITHITQQEGTATETIYHYTLQSWDENDSTPNPCYGMKSCNIVIGHTHFEDGRGEFSKILSIPSTENITTIGALGTAVKKSLNLPYSDTVKHSGNRVIDECVGVLYQGDTTGFYLLPGNNCETPPPFPLDCKFSLNSGGEFSIDFPPLAANVTLDKYATAYIDIVCNEEGTISLQLEGNASHKMTLRSQQDVDPLYASVFINDKDAYDYTTYHLKKGINKLKLSAHILSTTPVPPSVYIGHEPLVLYYE